MWFSNGRWYSEKTLAGPNPTSGPHPLIGKTFRLNDENPFKEIYCVINDVRANKKGVEYVSYSFLKKLGGQAYDSFDTQELSVFKAIWEEVK